MSSIVKPLIACLVAIIAVTIILTRTDKVTNQWTEDEISYALRVATQDATAKIMDEGFIFGAEEEAEDFDVDLTRATEQFKKSFFTNLGSTVTETVVSETNVSLTGYVGYRNIYAVYATGEPAAAFAYTYSIGDKIYEFTLGDKVYVSDLNTGDETETLLSDYPEHYFSSKLTNENFRQVTVMQAINDYLTIFYSDEQNIIAINAGSGVRFDLGLVDYAADDPSIMTTLSSVIDGQGFFAVVDCWDTQTQEIVRVLSMGAAELVLKDNVAQNIIN